MERQQQHLVRCHSRHRTICRHDEPRDDGTGSVAGPKPRRPGWHGLDDGHPPHSKQHEPHRQFQQQTAGGVLFLLRDGSVHFMSENVHYETFRFMEERADGNVTGEF